MTHACLDKEIMLLLKPFIYATTRHYTNISVSAFVNIEGPHQSLCNQEKMTTQYSVFRSIQDVLVSHMVERLPF